MAAVTLNPEQMLKEAQWLHQRLAQLNNEIAQKNPDEQLKQLESVFLNEQKQLNELQNKVNSFFSSQQFLDGGDREEISNKLGESVGLINGFSQLQDQLIDCGELFAEAQEALQFKKESDLRSLHQRISQKMSEQNINPSIANNLTLMQKNISDALGQPVQTAQSQSEEIGMVGQLLTSVHELQKCLEHFKRSTSIDTLGVVMKTLKTLAQKNCPCIFAMSGTDSANIGKRPFFHIYQIHRNETPNQMTSDPDYGEKAFAHADGFAAGYMQRIRALRRSVVEVCLSGLEEAIGFEDGANVINFLNVLEEVEWYPKDAPPDTKNFAHMLFGAYYNQHLEARKKNTSLADPNDLKFKGDFGRNAFKMSGTGIESSIKIAAIKQVVNALKKVWKI